MTPGMLRDDFEARARLEARLLARRRAAPPTLPVLPRPAGGGPLWFAASLAQEGMWGRLGTAPRQPLIVGGLRLSGPLDTAALREAWAQVAARHETLRSTYEEGKDGGLVQVVAPGGAPPVEVRDARPGEAESLADAEQADRFDLGQGAGARLRVLREAPDVHLVAVCLHHFIGDARALECLTAELSAHYAAAVTGSPPQVPELPVQFADFAAWHRARVLGEPGRSTVAYWAKRLAGAQPAPLPADLGDPDAADPADIAGRTLSRPLPAGLFGAVREAAARLRTTPYVAGLAAFQVLLARRSGCRDIGVRAPVSYRDRGELRDLIADFSNDVVVRADLSGAPTLADVVAQVRDHCAADLARHEVPPHLLAGGLPEPGLLDGLFRAQFTAETELPLPGAVRLGPLRAEPFSPVPSTAARPLSLRLRHDGGPDASEGRLIVAYRTGLFSEARIGRLLDEYVALLTELTRSPQAPALR